MTSRYKIALLLGGSLCVALSLVKADAVPGGFAVDRYTSLWEHSPFTVSSIQQEAVPPGFADKLSLVSIAQIGSQDMVTLLNKESQERINVSPTSSPQGLKIVSVELSSDPQKDCVTIQKGDEVAKIKFDKIPSGGGQITQAPADNRPPAPLSPGVAQALTSANRVPVSARVVRIVSPVPYSPQSNGSGQQLPPTPGSSQ